MNKKNNKTHNTCQKETFSVCGDVLDRLQSDQVQPRSRLFFQTRECVVWAMWALSIVVGAVAVAVTLYVSLSVPYTLYEATHNNLLTALVSALPFIWLLVFFITAYLAIINLRHTRRGYRYSTVTLLGSSVFISFILGASLQAVGHGYNLDQTLGKWIDLYPSYEKQRYSMWQNPEAGRIIGTISTTTNATSTDEATEEDVSQTDHDYLLTDASQMVWQIDTRELSNRDLDKLATIGDNKVRLMGTTTSEGVFTVCGVFAWIPENISNRQGMYQTREAFVEMIRNHYTHIEGEIDPAYNGQEELVKAIAPDAEGVLDYPVSDVDGRDTDIRYCINLEAIRRSEYLLAN